MSHRMVGLLVGMGLALSAAGCMPAPDIESRTVGSIFNPYCMPDGSVVRYQFSDTEGSYEGTRGDPANCPWNQ